jgi:hypothetical protein
LQAVNLFTRESSVELSKSVKEMYRDWYKEGKEMSDWWTTTVRNLDLTSEMTEKAEVKRTDMLIYLYVSISIKLIIFRITCY